MVDKMALVTLHLQPADATVNGAAQALGVGAADLDQDFGVVKVSSKRGLFAVRVDAAVLSQADPSARESAVQHSDPVIVAY